MFTNPGYEYQRYIAEVTKNEDPLKRGRIVVKSFDFSGDDETDLLDSDDEENGWIEPALDWGWFYIPDIGETVEIEILASTPGDILPYQSSVMNPKITWRGKRFPADLGKRADGSSVTVKDGARPIPDEFKENYKRRGFATPLGHILYFDDMEGMSEICLSWKEDDKVHAIRLDKDGYHFEVEGGDSFHVSGKDADATAFLGNGAVKVAIANHLQTFYTTAITGIKATFDDHVHPTGMGPSGKSVTQFPSWNSAINSSKLTIPDG
jgi:hypothetical protein